MLSAAEIVTSFPLASSSIMITPEVTIVTGPLDPVLTEFVLKIVLVLVLVFVTIVVIPLNELKN